uniref:Small ribosomal subunit protein uS3c n=1 Tax=Malawimonas californiana TaxID=221722 RepID=A0A0B5GNM5_MALCL|nr:ribosomal protein S3 [Malawimonas californiana]AJF22864.1 ribosomal protein S3 [Malawimonas californiana]
MGQSINTTGLQLTTTKAWLSKWYVDTNYNSYLHEDILIRDYLSNKLKQLKLYNSKILIKRGNDIIKLFINIASIKRDQNFKGKDIKHIQEFIKDKDTDIIKNTLTKLTNKKIIINIRIVDNFDAQILSQYIARKLELRQQFKNIFNKIINKIERLKKNNRYKGLRIQCSGRPNGNEMASIQWYKYKQIPLHSFNTNVDYSYTTALTKYGICGIKVWIAYR